MKTKRILSILLVVCMLLAQLPPVVFAADLVPYVDPTDPDEPNKTCDTYTVLTDQTELTSGWYVVNSDVEISKRISVTGDVKLILVDGFTLNAVKGVNVSGGNSLTIYGQSGDGGTLTVFGDGGAGIGGNTYADCGSITINGGTINASVDGSTSGSRGAAIGGGRSRDNGVITINGGIVTARAYGTSSAIGGGGAQNAGSPAGAGGTILITGGTVTASATFGAAIGGGGATTVNTNGGAPGSITITGGTVTASAREGAAIGSGGGNTVAGGTITITGGTVTAHCSNSSSQTIGHGKDSDDSVSLRIDGMKVYASEDAADPVPAVDREGTCRGIWAKLEVCDPHSYDNTGACEYCGESGGPVAYVDPTDPNEPNKTAVCVPLTNNDTDRIDLTEGWYALIENVDGIFTFTVTGSVNLILCDGCTLNDTGGIIVNPGSSLTIWGQTEGSGTLSADGVSNHKPGIQNTDASVTINGGTVIATGAGQCAGIGGLYEYDVFETIESCGTVTVNGGTVVATGGSGAAGIGSGEKGDCGEITITGGTVTAIAGSYAQAIGSGSGIGSSGDLDIPGMKVTDPAGTLAGGREDACRGKRVTLEVCDPHEIENGACKWCGAVFSPVPYLDPTDEAEPDKTCNTYTLLTDRTELTSGWYVLNADVTISERITVTGEVNLILTDGATLTVPKGVNVSEGNSLTVYGQTNQTGALFAGTTDGTDKTCGYYNAGIGGGRSATGGTITINGGTINATGGIFGAGIGGGDEGAGGEITVNGGTVNATGGAPENKYSGAGIGGGSWGSGGSVTISGGTVTAVAGNANAQAIGRGDEYNYYALSEGSLTLYDEAVVLTGEDYQTVVTGDGRENACRGERAKIVSGDFGVSYLDPTDESEPNKTCDTYTILTDQTALTSGWYVVNSDAEITGRITVSGDVHLLLCDGCTLTASGGVNVADGNSLTIWAQSDATEEGSPVGRLNATGGRDEAGIGGGSGQTAGSITINGGDITAVCSAVKYSEDTTGAGIGGGNGGSGGEITINGGKVTAYSSVAFTDCEVHGAGIGGGYGCSGGEITINGGFVTANGGHYGAGVGGGEGGSGGRITISGGDVSGVSNGDGAGIGGGSGGDGGIIAITGGDVLADAAYGMDGAGIGGGNGGSGGSVTITGGTVTAVARLGGTQAIGCGQGSADSGDLIIDGMKVYASEDAADPVPAVDREGTCRGSWVKLTACDPHSFDGQTGKCEWCGTAGVAVTLSAAPAEGGTVTGGGRYADGASVTVTATANPGYAFANWTENGQEVSTDADYTFPLSGDRALTANFTQLDYEITVVGGTADVSTAHAGDTVTITANVPEAGHAFVQWTPTGSGIDYAQTDAWTTTFTMPAKDVTVTAVFKEITLPAISDQVYTGGEIRPTFGLFGVSLDGVDAVFPNRYALTYESNINAGTATVTLTFKDPVTGEPEPRMGTKSTTFTILPADISTATVTADDQTYIGAALTPAATVTWNGQTLTTDDYTLSYSDNVNAGTASVTVTGKGNFDANTSAAGSFTINKAPLTITANDQEYIYNGRIQGEGDTGYEDPAEIAEKITVKGLQGSDAVTSVILDGQATVAGVYDGEIVPSTAVIGKATGNYTITYVPGKLTITALSVTVNITGHNDTAVYDGSAHTISGYDVEVSNTLYTEADFTFSGSVGGYDTARRIDVGTTQMGLNPDRFRNTNTNFDVVFTVTDGYQTITARAVTVRAEDKEKTVGEDDPKLTATVEGTIGKDTVEYTLSREPGEDVGTYTITPSGDETQGNYTVTCSAGTLTIYRMCYFGHKLTETDAVKETCLSDGNSEYYTCSVCKKYFSDADGEREIEKDSWIIPATGHKWDEGAVTTPATCTTDGVRTFTCENDPSHTYTEPIPAAGHRMLRFAAVPATCEEPGSIEYFACSVCGSLFADPEGQTGITRDDIAVPALGHDYQSEVTTLATCTTNGVMTCICRNDPSHTYTEPIPATGHTMVKTVAAAATCTEPGNSEYDICSVCGRYYSDAAGEHEIEKDSWIIPALGHQWSEWVVSLEPTETEPGLETRTCAVCGETETREIPPITHVHTLAAAEAVPATCTEPGSIEYFVCSGCGRLFADAEGTREINVEDTAVPATGHSWGEWTVTTPAGCEAEGEETRICGNDPSHAEHRPIPATGHNWGEWKVTREPTESEEGEETRVCQNDPSHVEHRAISKLDCPSAHFTDVDLTQWYHEDLDFVVANGLMNGVAANLFAPDEALTRAMVVTVLYRLEGEPDAPESGFTDVYAGAWYEAAVNWAAANGITKGVSETQFAPEAEITREQMAVFFYRYAQFKGYDVTATSTLEQFTDAGEVSDWAVNGMVWAKEFHIVNGIAADLLAPKATAVRIQFVAMLHRYCVHIIVGLK